MAIFGITYKNVISAISATYDTTSPSNTIKTKEILILILLNYI
jgi:hypothetical protein